MSDTTFGRVVAERRSRLGLSLKDLARLVLREDGHGVSTQYIHDMEHDRRVPASHVLHELARALGVDPYYLAAVAGQCPTEITTYLHEHPAAAPAVVALFARASAAGFTDWDSVEIGPKSTRSASGR